MLKNEQNQVDVTEKIQEQAEDEKKDLDASVLDKKTPDITNNPIQLWVVPPIWQTGTYMLRLLYYIFTLSF